MNERIQLNFKSIFRMAVPVMLGSFIQFIIAITDTAFLGRIDELALNTVGNAGLIYLTLFITVQGLSEGLQILFARRHGENNPHACRELWWTAVPLFLGLAVVLLAAIFLVNGPLMDLLISDPLLARSMDDFLQVRSLAFIPGFMQLIILAYYMGVARTAIITYSMAITALFNIVLDYGLIYGAFGLPEMGMQGAAWASAIAETASFAFCLAYALADRRLGYLWRRPLTRKLLRFRNMLRVSSPLMLQRFASMSSWTLFFIFIEKMGSHELAISQIIRTLYFLAFIPIMGFSTTTRTYVSHYMGRSDYRRVIGSIRKLALYGSLTTLVLIHGFWFYPATIIGWITNDHTLVADTIPVLQVISFSMILFAATGVIFNAVSGIGDTRRAMWIEIGCIAIYLTGTYFFAVHDSTPSLLVVWCMEFVYFGSLGLASFVYFLYVPWKKIRL